MINKHRRIRVGDVLLFAENVTVAQRQHAPFGPHSGRLPIGREYRSVATLRLCSGVTLRDLIEREGEGS